MFSKIISYIINVLMWGIAIFLIALSLYELYVLFYHLFIPHDRIEHYNILGEVFFIFLYIEVVIAIKKYFDDQYHFPLRFFFYVAITDVVRHIIAVEKDPFQIFGYCIALVGLIFALFLMDLKKHKMKQIKESFDI